MNPTKEVRSYLTDSEHPARDTTPPPCPKCDETMQRVPDVAGNGTHEWPCWSWVCPWCGHEGRIHHQTTKRWPAARQTTLTGDEVVLALAVADRIQTGAEHVR